MSPGCDAVIVHEPAPVMVTVVALIVQFPLALKLTVKLDDAVALTVNGGSLTLLFASGLNVIVWLAFAMLNVCGTLAAAR